MKSYDIPSSRFLSEDECKALVKRIVGFARRDGITEVFLDSKWTGNLRWARNRTTTSGDVRDNEITVVRAVGSMPGASTTNQLDDRHLSETVHRAERMEEMQQQRSSAGHNDPPFIEAYPHPKIWSDTTYQQSAEVRAELMRSLTQPAEAAGMLSAGYMEVSAHGKSSMNTDRVWYYPYTQAQCSMTVRDPQGQGSGWAGRSGTDWGRLDASTLAAIALDKCVRSRNPVRLEPGRYTTILEPQAVGDLVQILFGGLPLSREYAEYGDPQYKQTDPRYRPDSQNPFNAGTGYSKLGTTVIDTRLTVSTDNMDPDLGFPPFNQWNVYHPGTWIRDGVLTELSYNRAYAVKRLGKNTGGASVFGGDFIGAFRMSAKGETTTIEEMIKTTKRGVLVTRFSGITIPPLDLKSMLVSGYTRDGTWLIENGAISKPIMNFRFTDSPFFVLNNVEQIGTPQPIFSPGTPIVVPSLKVRDFSFTSLSDAV